MIRALAQVSQVKGVPESFRAVYPARVSVKHIRTVADLVRFGAGLRIDCSGCGASRTLDGYELAQMGGGAGSIERLRRRLKCKRCGSRGPTLAVLPPI